MSGPGAREFRTLKGLGGTVGSIYARRLRYVGHTTEARSNCGGGLTSVKEFE